MVASKLRAFVDDTIISESTVSVKDTEFWMTKLKEFGMRVK